MKMQANYNKLPILGRFPGNSWFDSFFFTTFQKKLFSLIKKFLAFFEPYCFVFTLPKFWQPQQFTKNFYRRIKLKSSLIIDCTTIFKKKFELVKTYLLNLFKWWCNKIKLVLHHCFYKYWFNGKIRCHTMYSSLSPWRMSLYLFLDQGKFLLTGLSSTNWQACTLDESKMIISDRNIQNYSRTK